MQVLIFGEIRTVCTKRSIPFFTVALLQKNTRSAGCLKSGTVLGAAEPCLFCANIISSANAKVNQKNEYRAKSRLKNAGAERTTTIK